MYTYNPHLGLINAPPPYCLFSSKRPFSLSIYYQKGQNYINYGQDLIDHISPLMGGTPLRESNMGLLYNQCYLNLNDLGVISFHNFGCLVCCFLCLIIFGGPGTLLIGGVY